MHGSLALHRGSLFVGRYAKTAHVGIFDLDGHRLRGGFSFRDEELGRSSVHGLSVDDDRRIWVADGPSGYVRSFTLFGKDLNKWGQGSHEGRLEDRHGRIGEPVDIIARGDGDEGILYVASGGVRRHALSMHAPDGRWMRSLRCEGDPEQSFRSLSGVSLQGSFVYAAEKGRSRIQVFRDGEFHFTFTHPSRQGPFEPTAVAALEDGRMLVTAGGQASAVLLFSPSGRLLRILAEGGEKESSVYEPSDIVVESGEEDAHTRFAVIDRDGDRVQVYSLLGRYYGAFLEGESASTGSES